MIFYWQRPPVLFHSLCEGWSGCGSSGQMEKMAEKAQWFCICLGKQVQASRYC